MKIDFENEVFRKRIFSVYAPTDDPNVCCWILPCGTMLHLSIGNDQRPVYSHQSVTFVVEGIPESERVLAFNSAGAIRHTHSCRVVQIRKKPTEKQMYPLAGVFKTHYLYDSWVYGRTQLGMYCEDKELFRHYELGTNPAYIMEDVRNFFGIGKE